MRFPFTIEARMQLRAIDRPVALCILEMLSRFGESGVGDVSPLLGEWQGCFRLRCDDHRVIFGGLRTGLKLSRLAIDPRSISNSPVQEPFRRPESFLPRCHFNSAGESTVGLLRPLGTVRTRAAYQSPVAIATYGDQTGSASSVRHPEVTEYPRRRGEERLRESIV